MWVYGPSSLYGTHHIGIRRISQGGVREPTEVRLILQEGGYIMYLDAPVYIRGVQVRIGEILRQGGVREGAGATCRLWRPDEALLQVRQLTFLSSKLTFLSSKLTFLSYKLTFL